MIEYLCSDRCASVAVGCRFATRPCAWAKLPTDDASAQAEDPEADASSFLAAGDFLPKSKIHLVRQRDANAADPATVCYRNNLSQLTSRSDGFV